MADISEKIMSEFLDLLKKVNSMETLVNCIAKDHDELITKCTKMIQANQDVMTESLRQQNELVTKTNNALAESVNKAMSSIYSNVESATKASVNRIFQESELMSKIDSVVNLERIFKALAKSIDVPEPHTADDSADIELHRLNLTTRTLNCLHGANCHKLSDLKRFTTRRLMKIHGFGVSSLQEVREVLESNGWRLAS